MIRRSAPLQFVLALLFCHVVLAQDTGTFTPTGSMTRARAWHTATLLPNGKVLITGGTYSLGQVDAGELYDPATQTFTARGGATTATGIGTVLGNGQVLFTGSTAQLYDPITDIFAPTGSYVGPFSYGSYFYPDTATLLQDGRVLIVGNASGDGYLEREELYDPVTGTFTMTGKLRTFDFGSDIWSAHTATLLPNGKVLLAGGESEDFGPFSIAELYDPSTNTFTRIANMTTPRSGHTATLLPDGTVLLAGGQAFAGGTSAEIYNPATGTFSATGNMSTPRVWPAATLLRDGTVLMTGGERDGQVPLASAELYVPSVSVPVPVVTGLQFDRASVVTGSSYSVNFSGTSLTGETFFDVRFIAPESKVSAVALNWQRGLTATHRMPDGIASGVWTINGVRAHQLETDHTGNFDPLSATIKITPLAVVTVLQFDRPNVLAGGSYLVSLSGSNLTAQTFFDVRFTAPGSDTSNVALNWQTGLASSHAVPLSTAPGNWTINGVHAHQDEADHNGAFNPVSATITVVQFPFQ